MIEFNVKDIFDNELSNEEKGYLLSMLNVVKDQGFENWIKRGANFNSLFCPSNIEKTEYVLRFGNFDLRVSLDVINSRYYLQYDNRRVDLFLMDSWEKIDQFIAETFIYNPLEEDVAK